MNDKNRSQIRRTLMIYLDCVDTATNNEVGKIVDITYEGLLLLSETPIPVGTTGTYKILLPAMPSFDEVHLKLKAICRWSRTAEASNFYYMGLAFQEKDEDVDSTIDLLVSKIGFSDGQKKISINISESEYK